MKDNYKLQKTPQHKPHKSWKKGGGGFTEITTFVFLIKKGFNLKKLTQFLKITVFNSECAFACYQHIIVSTYCIQKFIAEERFLFEEKGQKNN